jgi:hypothetical protein
MEICLMVIIIRLDLFRIINKINKKILDIDIFINVFKNTIINILNPNKWLYPKADGERLVSSFKSIPWKPNTTA